MVQICTTDDRALSLGRMVQVSVKRRLYATTMELAMQMAAEHRPAVILLDVKLGGSRYRAVEFVPWLLKASPLSVVVVLTYSPTPEEVAEVTELGAYCYVDLEATDRAEQVRAAVSSASQRRAATKGGGRAGGAAGGAAH